MICGLVLLIRRTPWLNEPSASKIPARKPASQEREGAGGQAIKRYIRSKLQRVPARIADISLRLLQAA